MIAFPVSSRVGNVRHDDAACMAPRLDPRPEDQGTLFSI